MTHPFSPSSDTSMLTLRFGYRDAIWSSCKIVDHPFGRQKAMLSLGLIDSFNRINCHPADSYVLDMHGISVKDYKQKVKEYAAQQSYN